MRFSGFLIALIGVLLSGCERTNGTFVCHFGVPGGDQYALTETVAKHITKNYLELADRSAADRTHKGKIYYVAPGCVPSFTFYEIVEPSDIQRIEELVRQSLDIAGIEKVNVVFYEKQNFVTSANGAGHRGHENAIKRITVTKAR
jgi:hypothetical protein